MIPNSTSALHLPTGSPHGHQPTQTSQQNNQPPSTFQRLGEFLLHVDVCSISPSTEARSLGVLLDLKNISRLWLLLTDSEFATTRLDFCSGVLFRVPSKATDRLQDVQNSGFLPIPNLGNTSRPPLKHRRWLPVPSSTFLTNTSSTPTDLSGPLARQYQSHLLHERPTSWIWPSVTMGLLPYPSHQQKNLLVITLTNAS